MMKVDVLDGGIGHLLKTHGVVCEGLPYEQQFIAGVLANVQTPDYVQEVHSAYLRAGSTVITTNSFSATPYTLQRLNLEDRLEELIQGAVACAKKAVNGVNSQALVAGCVPPLIESYQLPDLTDKEMDTTYHQIVKILESDVNLLLCETLSSRKEALSVMRVCQRYTLPFWISFTLEDSLEACLRSGESLVDVVEELLTWKKQPDVILMNCCAPSSITSGINAVRSQLIPHGIRFGGYANGFQTTTSEWLSSKKHSFDITKEDEYDQEGLILPEAYCNHVKKWKELGGSIFGGCCGTTPTHIQRITEVIL